MSDRIFGLAAGAFVDARVQHSAPTWSYRFTWRSPLRNGYYGSAHTFEIPFIFGTFVAEGAIGLLGTPTREMGVLSKEMQDAWVAFAAYRLPGHRQPSQVGPERRSGEADDALRRQERGGRRPLDPVEDRARAENSIS